MRSRGKLMATKKQKRALGEMRAKQETEERRQSGLAAQKADREQREERQQNKLAEEFMRNGQLRNVRARIGIDPDTGEPFDDDEQKYLARKAKMRTAFLNNGMNPSTGMPFTDDEMTEMEKKANTPERRHLFERIRAGRAGLLNEQPPVGGLDDYLVPLEEMTVGEFRDKMDQLYTGMGWNL
jgi:hypothetical protein